MYVFIFEGGDPKVSNQVTEQDKETADDGILEIIDMTNQKRYMDGEWIEMEKWENG